ncbi:fungal zn(2)-Cys(6) binuclear cluster domain-containing protein [Pochonia chlamydosporia 170]|uniref:Fungal zn(2)-Cys(6) binuclear cluster domain-containing protein n=1 Tax=Pochonia chlamydosporia 170 TaxID=1380566 RepID=A0A179F3S2_METCM|nr:fungal zn(2)-Cys(6) binuclear cluster domain-containing protein [Pochonia chlamydosporia 170]OAQ60052.1 fungal zn(2)-Cys(6) binuclear cluster domain-containing protein [Pochonia chlamydosporia 170]
MNQPVSLLCRIHQCDGKRPSCTHCVTQGSSCVYLTAAGETRFSALKRKYNSLEEELETLRNLYGYIQSRPLSEAHDLVAVIQACQDPTEATRRFLLHNDSIGDINAFAEAEISNVFLASGDVETSLAPAHYPVHVLAYPWTTIAGDEVVSKLISQFFIAERSLVLPIVNSSQFIEEMKGGDTTVAMYCSPLLVNAICAHQCFLSPDEPSQSTKRREMGQRFLDEAYILLRGSKSRANLVMAQAMNLLYQAELAKDILDVAVIA